MLEKNNSIRYEELPKDKKVEIMDFALDIMRDHPAMSKEDCINSAMEYYFKGDKNE